MVLIIDYEYFSYAQSVSKCINKDMMKIRIRKSL